MLMYEHIFLIHTIFICRRYVQRLDRFVRRFVLPVRRVTARVGVDLLPLEEDQTMGRQQKITAQRLIHF